MNKNEHIIEVAKGRIQISDGEVTVISKPKIKFCPTWQRVLNISGELNESVIKEIIERRMELGKLFQPDRILESDYLIFSFGASELLFCALNDGLIDAAVLVCDGAGTIISDKPKVVQGVGGWMSGMIKTSPIPEIISRLEDLGTIVVDKENAIINPLYGVQKAIETGYRSIAVTVAENDIDLIPIIKELDNECNITILSICTGAISKKDAQILTQADLVWSCASKEINEVVSPKSIFTTRRCKPIYALSNKGKRMILSGASQYTSHMALFVTNEPTMQPYPYI